MLSRLNDDWGWGRSQRSGESGLIPLMIMEDVVCVCVCCVSVCVRECVCACLLCVPVCVFCGVTIVREGKIMDGSGARKMFHHELQKAYALLPSVGVIDRIFQNRTVRSTSLFVWFILFLLCVSVCV